MNEITVVNLQIQVGPVNPQGQFVPTANKVVAVQLPGDQMDALEALARQVSDLRNTEDKEG